MAPVWLTTRNVVGLGTVKVCRASGGMVIDDPGPGAVNSGPSPAAVC